MSHTAWNAGFSRHSPPKAGETRNAEPRERAYSAKFA